MLCVSLSVVSEVEFCFVRDEKGGSERNHGSRSRRPLRTETLGNLTNDLKSTSGAAADRIPPPCTAQFLASAVRSPADQTRSVQVQRIPSDL